MTPTQSPTMASQATAELPKLPEPYSVKSTIKCTACGAPYAPPMTLAGGAAQWPGGLLPPHACRCGNTQFGGTVSSESLSPAQFTADQMNAHYLAGVEAGRASRAQSEWISVEDERKPVGRKPILVAVQWMNHYEHEDGTPARQEGCDVTEGEYVPQHGDRGGYFDSYAGPYDHDGWGITHWQPLPTPPATLGETK